MVAFWTIIWCSATVLLRQVNNELQQSRRDTADLNLAMSLKGKKHGGTRDLPSTSQVHAKSKNYSTIPDRRFSKYGLWPMIFLYTRQKCIRETNKEQEENYQPSSF